MVTYFPPKNLNFGTKAVTMIYLKLQLIIYVIWRPNSTNYLIILSYYYVFETA